MKETVAKMLLVKGELVVQIVEARVVKIVETTVRRVEEVVELTVQAKGELSQGVKMLATVQPQPVPQEPM